MKGYRSGYIKGINVEKIVRERERERKVIVILCRDVNLVKIPPWKSS